MAVTIIPTARTIRRSNLSEETNRSTIVGEIFLHSPIADDSTNEQTLREEKKRVQSFCRRSSYRCIRKHENRIEHTEKDRCIVWRFIEARLIPNLNSRKAFVSLRFNSNFTDIIRFDRMDRNVRCCTPLFSDGRFDIGKNLSCCM